MKLQLHEIECLDCRCEILLELKLWLKVNSFPKNKLHKGTSKREPERASLLTS